MTGWLHGMVGASVLLTWATVPPARGHGELHDRIAELGVQISQHPGEATLHFRRAEMRRLHQEWNEAEEDYRQAAELNPGLSAVRLGRATMMLDCGHAAEAEKLASDYLIEVPGQADGLRLRARARASLGRVADAVRDYDSALAVSAVVTPDMYLERAGILVQAVPPRRDEAVRGLEEGIKRLGPLLTLHEKAVELESADGRTDAALARIETVLIAQPGHLEWLARKWRLLVSSGCTADADSAKTAALAALQALPPRRRLLPAMAELERELRAAEPAAADPAPAAKIPE